jgi:hypothetical protein
MTETGIAPVFFSAVRTDLLVVLATIEDAMFLTMMFAA